MMPDTLDALVLDLLEWLCAAPRPYAEVMEAWRTSCPRLPVWEEANDCGFIQRSHGPVRGETIAVSTAGRDFLSMHRPSVI